MIITPETEPSIYQIEFEEFKGPNPEHTEVYTFPNRVTRANWASYLVDDFSFSMGQEPVQSARHLWLYLNQGFDQWATQEAFFDAGGLSCLSAAERSEIRSAYTGVSKHSPKPSMPYRALNETLSNVLFQVQRSHSSNIQSLGLFATDLKDMPWLQTQNLLKEERKKLLKARRAM